ncbi:hypothetical protein [Terasakiella sp.]|uniref:hypothetical protein n=1 Tax=Terasakiella sp. TaxID=2034861 RepID=UPI003AA8EBFE
MGAKFSRGSFLAFQPPAGNAHPDLSVDLYFIFAGGCCFGFCFNGLIDMSEENALLVNVEEAARLVGVSETTFRKTLPDIRAQWPAGGDDCPVRIWGTHGRSYQIDIELYRNWRKAIEDKAADEQRQRDEALAARQSQLDLEGGVDKGVYQLPLEVRKKAAETAITEQKLARERQDLVKKDSVIEGYVRILGIAAVHHRMQGDRLSRQLDIPPVVLTLMDEENLRCQEDMARAISQADEIDIDLDTFDNVCSQIRIALLENKGVKVNAEGDGRTVVG